MSDNCPECGKPYLKKTTLEHHDPENDSYLEIYVHERDGRLITKACNRLVE